MTDLRRFIELLEERGELVRIGAEVDPVLEIAAITDRVCKSPGGGRALFFEKVSGHDLPVLTNLFGSHRRTAWTLGVDEVEEPAGRLAARLAGTPGAGADERLRRLLGSLEGEPCRAARGACREELWPQPDLTRLPALKGWPGDGGRFLTLPLVFTRDPETGERNCGMYRMQIFDPGSAGMHWRPNSDGFRHFRAWQQRGERMPVAVALGGDPALIYAAGAPLPEGADEVAFAGFLRRQPVAMVPCLNSDLEVPAAAEIILEGFVEPGQCRPEGPFGNHTGFYVPPQPVPVFHVTVVTSRRDPLYPCTVVGPPPMENGYLAKATERLFLPLLQLDFPEIVDINLPMATIFHGCALVAVDRHRVRSPGELIRRLWRTGFFRSSRLLVLLDGKEDVRDPARAYWRVVNLIDPGRDLIVEEGKIGIDATGPGKGDEVRADPAVLARVSRRWPEYGIDAEMG